MLRAHAAYVGREVLSSWWPGERVTGDHLKSQLLAWPEGVRLRGRAEMDDIKGNLEMVILHVDGRVTSKSAELGQCHILISAERMTDRDDVPTRS